MLMSKNLFKVLISLVSKEIFLAFMIELIKATFFSNRKEFAVLLCSKEIHIPYLPIHCSILPPLGMLIVGGATPYKVKKKKCRLNQPKKCYNTLLCKNK